MNDATGPPLPPLPEPLPTLTRRQRIRRFIRRRLWSYPLLYFCVVLVFLALERTLVFRPSSHQDSWLDPVDPRTADVFFADASGTKLHGWWLPPDNPGAGAVLLAHGNGGNVSHRGRTAYELRRTLGAGVLLFDYPGYGKSEGKPTEETCYASTEAAYDWLTNEGGIAPNRVVIMGESLGGGPAVDLATHRDHRALVLLFTFTSLPAAAKYHYPFLPTKWLMRTRFDNLAKIGQCRGPVFVAHGTADNVVPFRQGEELYAAANEPKQFLRMEGKSHDLLVGEEFFQALANFLKERAP